MRRNNLDTLIRDTYIEFNRELDAYDNLEIPDFNNVMDKFYNNVKKEKNRSLFKKKLALIAGFITVVFFSAVLSPIYQVNAFKFNFVKTVEEIKEEYINIRLSTNDDLKENSIDNLRRENNRNFGGINDRRDQIEKFVSMEEAKKEVPFELLSPKYLPDEYKLNNVKLLKSVGGLFMVDQTYINDENLYITIIQTTIRPNIEETICFSAQFRREYLNVNNLKITFFTDDKNFKNMIWISNNIKFQMLVPYSVSDKDIDRIIKSLK